MRRLRRSVKVATTRTISVGHHANECMPPAPSLPPILSREHYRNAIVQPNRKTAKHPEFRKLSDRHTRPVYTDVYERFRTVKRGVYTGPAPAERPGGGVRPYPLVCLRLCRTDSR
jgi:hypothetical protein